MEAHCTCFYLRVLQFFRIECFRSFSNLRSHVAIDIILIQYATPAACTHIIIYSAKIFRRPKFLPSQHRTSYCASPRIMSSRKEKAEGNGKRSECGTYFYLLSEWKYMSSPEFLFYNNGQRPKWCANDYKHLLLVLVSQDALEMR